MDKKEEDTFSGYPSDDQKKSAERRADNICDGGESDGACAMQLDSSFSVDSGQLKDMIEDHDLNEIFLDDAEMKTPGQQVSTESIFGSAGGSSTCANIIPAEGGSTSLSPPSSSLPSASVMTEWLTKHFEQMKPFDKSMTQPDQMEAQGGSGQEAMSQEVPLIEKRHYLKLMNRKRRAVSHWSSTSNEEEADAGEANDHFE